MALKNGTKSKPQIAFILISNLFIFGASVAGSLNIHVQQSVGGSQCVKSPSHQNSLVCPSLKTAAAALSAASSQANVGKVMVESGTFDACTEAENGAGVVLSVSSVWQFALGTVVEGKFRCRAFQASNAANISMVGLHVVGGQAIGGGAVMVTEQAMFKCENCTFSRCVSTCKVIRAPNSASTILSPSSTGVVAKTCDGLPGLDGLLYPYPGIQHYGSSVASVVRGGGAVFIWNAAASFINCQFENNRALSHGGSILFIVTEMPQHASGNEFQLQVEGSKVSNSSAEGVGGFIAGIDIFPVPSFPKANRQLPRIRVLNNFARLSSSSLTQSTCSGAFVFLSFHGPSSIVANVSSNVVQNVTGGICESPLFATIQLLATGLSTLSTFEVNDNQLQINPCPAGNCGVSVIAYDTVNVSMIMNDNNIIAHPISSVQGDQARTILNIGMVGSEDTKRSFNHSMIQADGNSMMKEGDEILNELMGVFLFHTYSSSLFINNNIFFGQHVPSRNGGIPSALNVGFSSYNLMLEDVPQSVSVEMNYNVFMIYQVPNAMSFVSAIQFSNDENQEGDPRPIHLNLQVCRNTIEGNLRNGVPAELVQNSQGDSRSVISLSLSYVHNTSSIVVDGNSARNFLGSFISATSIGSPGLQMNIHDSHGSNMQSAFTAAIVVFISASSSSNRLSFYNNTVLNFTNYGQNGGGLAVSAPPSSVLEIVDNHFSHCKVTTESLPPKSQGGAILINGVTELVETEATISISSERNSFFRCSASGFGGAVAAVHVPQNQRGGMFTMASVGNSFTECQAKRGGGMDIFSGNVEKLSSFSDAGSIYWRNQAEDTDGVGGGLAIQNCDAVLESLMFQENSAKFSGGAILVQSGVTHADIRNTQLSNNTAQGTASSILWLASGSVRSSNFTVESSTFDQVVQIWGTRNVTLDDFTLQCPLYAKANIEVGPDTPALGFQGAACSPCGGDLYTLDNDGHTDTSGSVIHKGECHSCPFGAFCRSSTSEGTQTQSSLAESVLSKPNYFGLVNQQNYLKFYLCETGHCCNNASGCSPINSCEAGREGLLCSQCKPSHSLALFSDACVPDWLCGNSLSIILLSFVFTIDALFGAWLTISSLWAQSGVTKVLVYFLQVFSLVSFPLQESNAYTSVVQSLSSLARQSPELPHYLFTCPLQGLSTWSKLGVQLFGTVIVFLSSVLCAFLLKHSANHKVRRFLALLLRTQRTESKHGKIEPNSDSGTINGSPNGESSHSGVFDVRSLVAIAIVQASLMTYSSVVTPLLSTLRCMPIEGTSVMRMNSSEHCFNVRQALVLTALLIVFVPMPLLAVGLTRKSGIARFVPHVDQVVKFLQGPFTFQHKYWESVILSRRLIIAAVYALINQPILRQSILFAVCLMALISHQLCRPFRKREDTLLETGSLTVLTLASALSMITACLYATGAPNAGIVRTVLSAVAVVQDIAAAAVLLAAVTLWLNNHRAGGARRQKTTSSVRKWP